MLARQMEYTDGVCGTCWRGGWNVPMRVQLQFFRQIFEGSFAGVIHGSEATLVCDWRDRLDVLAGWMKPTREVNGMG